MRVVLTIAGSDSSAGAGLQADLKTLAALGVYGVSAVTAVTAQSTTGVCDVSALPAQIVRSQIDAVAGDMTLSAVKTGMLANAEIVLAVADAIRRLDLPNLVVDPVMVAGSPGGRTLLQPDGVQIMKVRLLPLATIATPNADEAGALTGIEVTSLAAAREAARALVAMGARAAVVKGGHLPGRDAIDVLYDGSAFSEFASTRDGGGPIHGAGCAFASAIAAGLALGDDIAGAVRRAKTFVTGAIEHSGRPGSGARVLAHFWNYTQ